jgi:hypothetical protein
MKFCVECGTRLNASARFCSGCGVKQPDEPEPNVAPAAEPGWGPPHQLRQPRSRRHWRLIFPALLIMAVVTVIIVTRDGSGSCSETAQKWARMAERVGPDGIQQVRADANVEIVDNEVRIAAQQAINLVANAYIVGGSSQLPIPDSQLDSFTDRACNRTDGDDG